MSDTFELCPKCGEEVERVKAMFGYLYYCSSCKTYWSDKDIRIVTTEYFKGEKDEKKN